MIRSIFRSKWVALIAVPVVLAGMAVEGGTRVLSRRAVGPYRQALRDAQGDVSLSTEARAVFEESARRRSRWRRTVPNLNDLARREPSEVAHRAAAYLALSRRQGAQAARHLQLAARLAPDDADAQRRAEQGVNVALLFQAQPYTRPLTYGAGGLLALFVFGALRRRGARRRLRKYVDNLRAEASVKIDGEARRKAVVGPDTQSMSVDLFLKGRYGMSCPRLMRQRPPIHVSFSQAASSRTVRLTPVREVSDAIRIHVRPDTLDLLRAAPGDWRMHVRMNERTLALTSLTVATRTDKRPLLDRARGWFGA